MGFRMQNYENYPKGTKYRRNNNITKVSHPLQVDKGRHGYSPFSSAFRFLNFPDKSLREKARVLKKLFLAAKYAKYERLSKPLYISNL